MTPFGLSVARELRSARVPIETVSIVDHIHLASSLRALLKNALFWVVPERATEDARARTIAAADKLAATIRDVGVQPYGVSLEVDHARQDALDAFDALVEAIADAEPTQSARSLGIA